MKFEAGEMKVEVGDAMVDVEGPSAKRGHCPWGVVEKVEGDRVSVRLEVGSWSTRLNRERADQSTTPMLPGGVSDIDEVLEALRMARAALPTMRVGQIVEEAIVWQGKTGKRIGFLGDRELVSSLIDYATRRSGR